MRLFSPALPRFRAIDRDKSVLIGASASLGLVILAILASGRVSNYFDFWSLALVVGGTLGATITHFSWQEVRSAIDSFTAVSRRFPSDMSERISYFVDSAAQMRARGPLHLERESEYISDPFLRHAFQLVVDAQSPEEIRRILESEMRAHFDRTGRAVQVFETLGGYAPALGLIGTLLGLVQMLGTLQNPETIGPAMSLALLTTLYGAVLANLFFLPMAGKIRKFNEELWLERQMTIEAVLSMAKQESPVILEQRLQSFLPHGQSI